MRRIAEIAPRLDHAADRLLVRPGHDDHLRGAGAGHHLGLRHYLSLHIGHPLVFHDKAYSIAPFTTAKILDDNVTTAKILDANVTTAKIAVGAITHDGVLAAAERIAACTDGQILKYIDASDGWECAADDAGDSFPAMTDAQIIVSNNTTPSAVALSGEATISNTGAITIANDAITSAKIDDATIVAADLAARRGHARGVERSRPWQSARGRSGCDQRGDAARHEPVQDSRVSPATAR